MSLTFQGLRCYEFRGRFAKKQKTTYMKKKNTEIQKFRWGNDPLTELYDKNRQFFVSVDSYHIRISNSQSYYF